MENEFILLNKGKYLQPLEALQSPIKSQQTSSSVLTAGISLCTAAQPLVRMRIRSSSPKDRPTIQAGINKGNVMEATMQ